MGKVKMVLIVVGLMFLSGCSLLTEVNDSIDYVNTATEHVAKLNTFADEAPQLVQAAVTDPEAKQELETKLITLKQDIEEFISTQNIPTVAEDIHQEFVAKNEVLLGEINQALDNGNLALDKLENMELFTTINEVTDLLNRLENIVQ
ncbi:hypothetical protein SAMN05192533_11278 [Mesobacillus persicus]|uniref:Lipoprotein n=1 Tax=Mesobacillus persicus TaxID=930146 RepID=A0A1H8G3C9_9BACI|nr:DUF6376 family protein [Mesobacillus persicus]SEN38591.1 hypothetical protein SAMN05192533_11278 [Mesobacillus persicus]